MTLASRMVAMARGETPSKHVTQVTGVTSQVSPPSAGVQSPVVTAVTGLQPENVEFEERAGIIEYDGGLPRHEAERLARLCLSGADHAHIDDEARRADAAAGHVSQVAP